MSQVGRLAYVWMLLPMRCNRLAVSLKDPDAFLEALAKAGVAAGSPG